MALVGVVELLLFGCCAAGMMVAEPSLADLRQSPMGLPPDMSEEQLTALARGIQAVVAAAAVVVFVLPGLALLGMSPWIDRGSPGAVTAARVILWIHAIVAGGLILLNVLMSALMLNVLNLLVTAVFVGGLLALQVSAIRSLGGRGMTAAALAEEEPFEPWNSHLD